MNIIYQGRTKQIEKGLTVKEALEEEIKNVFPLTINEWLWLDHILNAQMRTFEDMNAARLYKIAKDEEWANKSAATAQPSSH